MALLSGILCAVDGEGRAAEWEINKFKRPRPTSDSASGGAMSRACAVNDWRGWYRGYGYTPTVFPVKFPGDEISFVGQVKAAKSVDGTGIIDRITLDWNIERDEKIAYRVDFSRKSTDLNTEATSTATDPLIASPEANVCSQDMYVALDGVAHPRIRRMRLIISSANLAGVDSSTSGGVERIAGNIDAQCVFQFYQTDAVFTLEALNTPKVFRWYVTATTYWELKWMILEELQYGANREGRTPVGGTYEGAFTATWGTSGIGYITNPAGVDKWGTS